MNRQTARLLILTLVMVATFSATVAHAQPPPPPHAFFGTVEVNGQPAPIGVKIEARGANVKTGSDIDNPFTTTEVGRYGGGSMDVPALLVQGGSESRIESGTPIEFYVDGVKAECAVPGGPWQSSYPFQSGDVTELNLRVVAAEQPTDAPTATTQSTVGAPEVTSIPATETPVPTATRQSTGPTLTPIPAATAVQTTAPVATSGPVPAATPLPGAVVSTPTGLAPQAVGVTSSATPESAQLPAATIAPEETQASAGATPGSTQAAPAVAQSVATSAPILQGTSATQPAPAASDNAEAGSGRMVALWGGLGTLLIAIAVGVFIKVRH